MNDEFETIDENYINELKKDRIDQTVFKTMYLGNFIKPECSVQDNQGKHCPDKVSHYIEHNGKEIKLCERCYVAYKNGAFGKRRA